ncbi:MAG: LysR family transcriptional regulator, partial [Ectothiorhodospiraceae bacterium]|nr:LysR family transcriptional regulator [Ectothiorhodospiraceae bacterium]
MKLNQLRYICEVARRDLNVSAAAEALFTSQPGVSKQIRMLEAELGVQIFERSGKHLTRITPAGVDILEAATRILEDVRNIRSIAEEHKDEARGSLSIATTHTQARHALPPVVKSFLQRYPRVSLHMHQGTPMQIADQAARGVVDFAIATEAIELFEDLVMMPCYKWNRSVIVPVGQPLLYNETLTLHDL